MFKFLRVLSRSLWGNPQRISDFLGHFLTYPPTHIQFSSYTKGYYRYATKPKNRIFVDAPLWESQMIIKTKFSWYLLALTFYGSKLQVQFNLVVIFSCLILLFWVMFFWLDIIKRWFDRSQPLSANEDINFIVSYSQCQNSICILLFKVFWQWLLE